MKITHGMSRIGQMEEALRQINNPAAIIFSVTEEGNLAQAAQAVENFFPGVPAIGAVGPAYAAKETNMDGFSAIGISDGIRVIANVLEEASVRPIKYIRRLEADVDEIGFEEGRVACFDLCCAGTDMKSITTLNSKFKSMGIELAGGTSNSAAIAVNGQVYPDSCAYLLIKNLNGRVKAYRENIYRPMEGDDMRLLVTDAVPHDYKVLEMNGMPAGDVYKQRLNITNEEAATQTFSNPFGHMLGTETYIVSIKDIDEEGNITTFRPVNTLDVLTILELDDYKQVVENTVAQMEEDLGNVSAVISVNCLFRYILYHDQKDFWDGYLGKMSEKFEHGGFIGVGEHYCGQFVNQTMSGLAFE